jgi:branched-chain amino acid transport system substrate-binding protein
MQEMIEFWAMDSEPAGVGYATMNIVFQSQPFPIKVDDLCAILPSFYEQMGAELVDAECGLEINDLDAARFVTCLRMGPLAVKGYQYAYVREGDVWFLNLAVDETEWSEYEPIFATIAESFRVDYPTTARAGACQDALGCVQVGPGEPIRIGYAMVVSGPDAALGIDTRRGVEIAIDDRPAILDHPIELIGEDDGCSAQGGQAAAIKLAADPKLVAVVGTNCSSAARAAIPILCQAGISMVSPSNTGSDLTAAERPAEYWCYMRTSPNDRWQGTAMARLSWEKGFRRAATIHDGSLYADTLQQEFAEEFEKLGGSITAQVEVVPTDINMKPVLTRIAASKPQLLYYPVFITTGRYITRQARQTPGLEDVQLAGADGIFSPDLLAAAGEATLGIYLSSPDFSNFPVSYGGFLEKYQNKYGERPPAPFHAYAYDATMMILAAIEGVAVLGPDGSLGIGRQALRDALFATRDVRGLTGWLSCSPSGDCAATRMAVYEVVNADPASWDPGSGPDDNPSRIWP